MTNSNLPSTLPSPRPPLVNKLLGSIALLGLVGFADSAYLTADHYFNLPLPCSLTHGCETVLHSAYSMIGPIPLAACGVAYYLAVMFYALYLLTKEHAIGKLEMSALFGMITIGFGMSVIFELMQAFLIHAFCQYCALSALVTLLLLIVGVWLVRVWSLGKN